MPDDDPDPILEPLRESVTAERWAEIEAAAKAMERTDDEADTYRLFDLLTPAEEDIMVAGFVADVQAEIVGGPTPPAVAQHVATLVENQLRCRVRATATVIEVVEVVPFDPGNPGAGDLITVDVIVSSPVASGRFRLISPCETEAQRAELTTPGHVLSVRVSARDPRRITVDFTDS